jgi:hypothetical protein
VRRLGAPNFNGRSQKETDGFRAEVSHALCYSPDFAPSDFNLFLHLKEHRAGKSIDDDDEVQEQVMTLFQMPAADFYDSGKQKLFPRLNKCLNNTGDYVEKQSYVQAIHSQCRFSKLKMLYMFQTFVSLLSGHASYMNIYIFFQTTLLVTSSFECI